LKNKFVYKVFIIDIFSPNLHISYIINMTINPIFLPLVPAIIIKCRLLAPSYRISLS